MLRPYSRPEKILRPVKHLVTELRSKKKKWALTIPPCIKLTTNKKYEMYITQPCLPDNDDLCTKFVVLSESFFFSSNFEIWFVKHLTKKIYYCVVLLLKILIITLTLIKTYFFVAVGLFFLN